MAKLLFDANRQLDTPTLILESKSGKRYGSIDGVSGLTYKKPMTNPDELSFKVSKYINGNVNYLWDDLTDFKTVYIPEYEEKFEITVLYSDDEQEEKSVTGTSLCESELGQTIVRGLEINTDSDLEAKNYEVTKFYNPNNTELSLLHRVLKQKCSHYSIAHVDKTLCDLVFEFTADETSVYDFLTGDVAEKMQCLFLFNSMTREISVYDLCSTCNDCYDEVIGRDKSEWKHYRDDFHGVCPKCGSTNITEGFGKDTTVLVDKENVATSITRETDANSLKNCLYVSGGDDLIDAAFIMSNPNGSQYIYRFTDEMIDEMPDDFKSAWNKYYALYDEYNVNHEFVVEQSVVTSFDNIVTTISSLSETEPYSNYKNHKTPTLRGMKSLVTAYYNGIDLESFIQTGMCPTYKIEEYDKYHALSLLNSENIGIIAISGLDNKTTKTVINNAVLQVAKTLVNTALYDVEIIDSNYSSGVWSGVFSVTDRHDENEETNTITNSNYLQIAKKEGVSVTENISSSVSVSINGDVLTYCKNNIIKAIAKSDLPVANDLYSLDITEKHFGTMIKLYSIDNLNIVYNTLLSCCNTLAQGLNDDNAVVQELNSYYGRYYTRMVMVTNEINLKSSYISTIVNYETAINSQIKNVHNILNFENYMKKYSSTVNLWDIFNYYRREDTYKNENIISDSLESNASLLQYANYLMTYAERELIKASTPQITINTNLYNLLMLPEFEPLLESFEVGNWIRVRTDIREDLLEDSIYKLRLLSYQINFDEKERIDVEFSTTTQTWNDMRDVKSIIQSAQTIATSFDSVKKEVEKSVVAAEKVNNWVNDGLDLTNQKIVSDANNQSILIDNHGILARRYDDITDSYDDCQLKIFNNGLYTTHDNWKSIDAGVGKFTWKNPNNNWQEEETYGIIARKIVGEMILGKEARFVNSKGTMSFTENGFSVSNGTNTITINPNGNAFEILKGSEKQLYIDTDGNINLSGGAKISWSELTDSNGKTLTSITESTIQTTTVTAENLKVRSANIDGTITANSVVSNWVYTGDITANQIKTGIITSSDGKSTVINLDNNTFNFGSGALSWNGSTLSVTGIVNATSGTFEGNITSKATISGGNITGANISAANGNFSVNNDGTVSIKGNLYSNGAIYLLKPTDETGDSKYENVMYWSNVGDMSELVIGDGRQVWISDLHVGNIFVESRVGEKHTYISNGGYIKSNLVSTDTVIVDDESKTYKLFGLNKSNNLHIGSGLYDDSLPSDTYVSAGVDLHLRAKTGSIIVESNLNVSTVNGVLFDNLVDQVSLLVARVTELESKIK